ncbi:7-carboxy-7-deazaguanine synthase QueE [Methanobrevibacter sp. OttesenSCG-928-K11]|nr:7-carboxy-7-deazaguanine synthase QueE [Methanobrevibacter sp. OttesenSCG-928-K11]MDL2271350.1 7-carboxy-7-deazaguanine synthase QueE [Methanobrevibacter sp. OttesenSCG-928-I08]
MKAPIVEIFSSIQGEGLFIGKRQIFVRFAGCNLNCTYCDTEISKSKNSGSILTVDDVIKKIEELVSPDLHSISFTGGEPSLYYDFINEIIKKIDYKTMLETNGTLTKNISKLNLIDFVSLDIKLPDHFNENWSDDILDNEIKTLNLLISNSKSVYCKLVVLPSMKINSIEKIIKKLSNEITNQNGLQIIIQPSSPIDEWKSLNKHLFEISETVGKYFEVSTIPQVHKFLNIE